MSKFSFLFLFICIYIKITAQVSTGPAIAWQQCYGGTGDDYFTNAINTSDKGILVCLKVNSTDGDLLGKPESLGWIIKYDSLMGIEWEKFLEEDLCNISPKKVLQLNDGSYLVAGYSTLICPDNHGESDLGLMKIDSYGNTEWIKSYGSPGGDVFESVFSTSDGGFILSCRCGTSGGDIPYHYGDGFGDDAVLIKVDSAGEILWVRVLGGSDDDGPLGNIVENERGYYIVNIGAHSNDYDLSESGIIGDKRWLLKIDSLGNIVNEKFYSGTTDFYTYTGPAILPYHNGILVAGQGNPDSELYPTAPMHASDEGAVAIFDSSLELTFFKQWGGSKFDAFVRVVKDEQNNFYFLGTSLSYDYDVPANNNGGEALDYWVLAVDSNFNILWSRNFGGSYYCGDLACGAFSGDIIVKNNFLYVFVKNVVPEVLPDYDIECGHYNSFDDNSTDGWLTVFDLNTSIPDNPTNKNNFTIYPNPASNELTIDLLDKSNNEVRIEIYNSSGILVLENNYAEVVPLKINTENLLSGLYVIKISGETSSYTSKIIIQH